jgi:Invasin, domain 3/Bacterial Ig-like domain (group 1)/Bacterial surface protein, Ig-like domain
MKKRGFNLNGRFCSIVGLASAIIFLLAQGARGGQVTQTLPFYDSFDYNPASGLASASSTVWETCYSTANIQVTGNSLTLAGFVPSAGNSVVGATKGTRFAGTQFTSQTAAEGKTVYASFLYQVTGYPTASLGVIGFLDVTNIGTSSSAPMPPTTALALLIDHSGHIGINAGSPTASGAQFETSATALNTTVLIVARYTFHTTPSKDAVDLWINPSSASYGAASAPTPDKSVTGTVNLASLGYFTSSFNGNDTTFGEKWDEVRIGTAWAHVVPSSNPPGSASAAHSAMISASPTSIVADGASTSVVKMQARDLNGVNLTSGGSTVTFATTLGAVSSTTDNGDGTYQATLTSSTTLGSANVTAKLGGTAIASIGTATSSASLTVNFVLGPVSATASTAVASPTTVAADGSTPSTITITAKDDYNHPIAGQTVSLSVSGSGNTVSTPAATDANGRTTATLTSTVGETKTITVTIGSTQINAQPTVTFTAQGVSTSKSTAVASPNSGLVADGVSASTITVTAKDGSGNPLPGKTVALAVSGSGNILTQPSSTTDVNGQITATLESTVAEAKTITVTVDGTVINAQPTVTFLAGAATHIAFTPGPVTTPVGLTMPAVVVQIEDQYGNAVSQSGATATLALSAGTLSGTNPQMTDASGKATFNGLSIQPISSGLYLTASVAGFSPLQSSLFDVPPKAFYKVNNSTALNLPASWTTVSGGTGPAGPPAADGIGNWDTNSSGGTVDIGANASWYGLVMSSSGAVTITDTGGGNTLTLGAGSLDGSSAVHSFTINPNVALGADQTWKWTANAYTLTIAGNLDNGGHLLTINGLNGPEKFNGAITGNGGLTLTASAAVTLSGTNTYSGDTTVNGGKLIINTNGSIANTPSIALASGTTLDISAASPFTLLGGQALLGGTSGTGTATIKGTLVLAPSAQAAFTAIGNASSSSSVTVGKLTVQGAVTLNGNALAVNVTGVPLPAGTYTLMTANNGFTVNGSLPLPTITGQGLANGSVPQIAINGQNLQLLVGFSVSPTGITNHCGDSATFTATPALGATSYQWYAPSLQPIPGATNTTLVLTNTHPSDSGTYLIVATGPSGGLTNSVVLLNTDTAPPVMTLNGTSTIALTLGAAYTELGATAYDACAGSSVAVTTTGTVNTSMAGEYYLTYSAITGAGIPGSLTRAVVVIDPTVVVPGITLNLDFGAATDANPLNPITPPPGWSLLAYGDLYQNPNVWGSPAFPNPDGNHPGLTLSFGDISGWSTASGEANGANSSATVGISTNGFFNYGAKGSGLPATFTLSGVPFGECVSIYAVNGWGGAAKAPVIVYGGQTNTVTAGSFDVSPSMGAFQCVGTAIVTNGSVTGSWTGIGGPTVEGQIGGMIIQVQSLPLNNLAVAPSSVAAQCGSNVTFTASVYGLPPIAYQWYDNNGNAIPGATNTSYTLLAPTDASAGNYTVVVQNAYNSLTNSASITAVLHTAPPAMSLNGANPVNLMLNNPYVDAGVTAYDLCAQASLAVSSNSTVNTSVVGTYTVTYAATTADGTPGTMTRTVNVSTTPVFGPNVLIFDPTMTNIQSQCDFVTSQMKYNQFGTQRYALVFKPGQYSNLDINVGYYTQILGLGLMPDDVSVACYLHSDGVLVNENATQNFWRDAENLTIVPTNSNNYMMWAVSQGTALRRMHIQGNIDLANHTDGNWSSGGFMADSKVDATISSISQQQWLSRNDVWGTWSGGVWNMVFVGVSNPPAGTWPAKSYTVITNTPLVAEKPYLYLDTNGNYAVMVPALQTNSVGTTWAAGPTPGVSLPISRFYVAHADSDNAASINAALNSGLNLILAPGVYQLSGSLQVTRPDTVILGLGYATLIPQTGAPAMVVSDVDGVKVAGVVFDAGPVRSTTLLQVGTTKSLLDHSGDPIFLYDIFMRVGGAAAGSTESCLEINANDVVGDNLWLWRADHGNGVGWTQNACNNGLIVNGDRVTMYGLFVEHQQQYETLWNGNWGRVYFYQSELPYDPPSQAAWSHNGVTGYASYKVADSVTSHQAYGLGVYGVFIDCTNISCFNAIETPTNSPQVNMHNMITVYIGGNTDGNGTSTMDHVINGTGAALSGPGFGGTATAKSLWLNPTFSLNTGVNAANASVTFPTECWRSYQLEYKDALTDPSWSNLGSPVGGNDSLQTIIDPTPATSRFYRIEVF